MYYKDITLTGPQVAIGYEDENLPTRVIIDISDLTKYGTGTTVLEVKRPCDREAYIAEQTEVDGNNFYWYPTKGDLEVSGLLKCQVKAVIGDQIVKTRVYYVRVIGALNGDGTLSGVVPDALQTFVESVSGSEDAAKASAEEAKASETAAAKSASDADASASAAADSAKQSYDQATASAESATASATSAGESEQSKTQAQEYAQNAYNSAVGAESAKDDAEDARDEIRSMRAEAVTLSPGSDATASYSDGLLSLGIPRGDKGETGATGATGPKGDKGDPGEVTQAEFDALADEVAPVIKNSASGAIASFPDGADGIPLKSCIVQIEPVQAGSGDPSPDNVRPISGWTGAKVTRAGKNLLDTSDITDYSKWSADIAPSGDMPSISNNRIYSLPALKSGVQYTISFGVTSASFPTYLYFGYYKDNSTKRIAYVTTEYIENQSISFTAIAGATYCLRMGAMNNEDAFKAQIAKLSYIQLELGSTATAYEPYQGQTYSITFPTEAGTVYGGSLTVNEDGTGTLVVDRAEVDLGTLTWSVTGDRFTVATKLVPNPIKRSTWEVGDPIAICSQYKYGNIGNGNGVDKAVGFYNAILYARDTAYATAADFQAAMSGVQLVYELATPITYTLTPQEITSLLGTNNLWADTGDMSVTYRADTKLYIDKKFTELQALILEN